MNRLPLLAVLLLAFGCGGSSSPEPSSTDVDATPPAEPVTIGYQGMINPWKSQIRTGTFEETTGRRIEWRRFSSGSEVITAMASGDVDVAVAGSSPIATALSQGLDLRLVWVLDAIDTAEALVVRSETGITSIDGLKGRKLGVPLASTTHYHLLFALERAGVATKDLTILNLQPDAIAASWKQKQIDAAFVWSPVLDTLRGDGTVLVTSGELAAAGRPTFDGLVARGPFAEENRPFLDALVQGIADADAAWRDSGADWTPETPEVAAIANLTGAPAETITGVLAQYRFPPPAEQASATWLSGDASGAAKALADTAAFLVAEGKVPRALDDYGRFVEDRHAAAAK